MGQFTSKVSFEPWALLSLNIKEKRFHSLDVYKLGACLQRLALCPFIGFPYLQHLACFLCFVVGTSIAD